MQTLHDILSRAEERFDLKNMGFCVLVVLVLVAVAFGLISIKTLFPKAPGEAQEKKVAVEKRSEM